MIQQKIIKKENRIFWSAILAGVVGGFIGNLYAGYLFRLENSIINHKPLFVDSLGVILFTIIFFALIYFIIKQISVNK